jgi:hypothetical protein
MPENRKPRRKRHSVKRKRSAPREPAITAGQFVGRRLSELSDDELLRFLRFDSLSQTGCTFEVIPPKPPEPGDLFNLNLPVASFPDLSQYWFARYELERRKLPDHKSSIPDLRSTTTPQQVARKMIDFAYKAFSKACHPDSGGTHELFVRLGRAKELLSKALR